MKGPITLVLISALIATPLFADTITLKTGQTYTGEIIGKTREYIKLKTESEVLTTETQAKSEEQAAGNDNASVKAQAEAAAEAHVNKMLWFAAGCLLNLVGVFLAYTARPSPPEAHLIGKSPEYVAEYTEAFQAKAKSIRTNHSLEGCVLSSAVLLTCWLVILGTYMRMYEY